MKIIQKLKITEERRDNAIVFFKEGVFWKCYNAHAMYFCLNVKPMKISTRWYKNVQQYVSSLGFPDNALPIYLRLIEKEYHPSHIQTDNLRVKITGIQWRESAHFSDWQEEYIVQAKKQEKQIKEEKERERLHATNPPCEMKVVSHPIVEAIRGFDAIHATPMQAFNFIIKLQNQLKVDP